MAAQKSRKTPKKLVVVESPAKAKTIVKFLGSSYEVVATQGHVRDLPKSQIGVDIENNFTPKYIPIRGRSEIIKTIKKQAKNAKCVYLATDPDREGEAIAWHLAQLLGLDLNQPCRIAFNEITKKAVQEAVKNPRPINLALVDAQQARRVLDRLVGYQISPLLWANVKKRLSAGRVQSAATLIICQREDEIEAFEPHHYYTLDVTLRSGKQTLAVRLLGNKSAVREFDHLPQAEQAQAALTGATAQVTEVRPSTRQQAAPAPFTTSTLQQEASRKLNFTTKRTMMVAQQLYEGVEIGGSHVGLVSYIRTDSVHLADDAVQAVRQHIAQAFGPEYLPEQPNVFKSRKSAQNAHEAIRPTDVARRPEDLKSALTSDQFKLYRLIYNRFVACQMAPAVYDTLQVDLAAQGYTLRYNGESLKFAGHRAAYIETAAEGGEEDTKPVSRLPEFEPGGQEPLTDVQIKPHETMPPPRYNEASLVRVMETLGIGRPSTYAPTISTLLERGYVCREGKNLLPTELGRIVNNIMLQHFGRIANVAFTAQMEDQLDDIEEGQQDYLNVLQEFYGPFASELQAAEQNMQKVEIRDEVSQVPCEKCGAMMVYKQGRYGKFLACPNFPECRNTKNIVTVLDLPCPKCGGQVQMRKTKTGRTFYGCNAYPNCDFRSWDRPISQTCPQCGGAMVLRRQRGQLQACCMDTACGTQTEYTGPVEE